jgi:Gpi18-like mannosyltransferase
VLAGDETISLSDETAPIDNVLSSPDEAILPITETGSSTDEIVAQTKETVPPTEAHQTWRTIAEPWWKATLAILPTFLITRFIFLLLSYFGGVLFFVKNYAATVIPFHEILYRWYYWDAIRFATIATHGYPTPDYAAFFPLFPTLVHIFAVLTHRDVLEASMFISNVAFLGVLIVLYRFVTIEFDKDTAQRTVLYISIFPTALFFFAGYNESLFLLLTLLCFYTVRRGSWWLAGLFGLLATLTRSSGIFLALVFVWEYLRQNWPLLREEWQYKELSRMVRPLANLTAMLLIPLGLAIYSFGLYRRFHDPLAFIHAQSNWRQGLTFPLYAPLATLKKLVTLPLFSFTTAHNIIDLTATVLFATLIIMCFFGPYRLNRSQWTLPLFGLLILITTMLYPNLPRAGGIYDPLASTQRLVLEAFVGFIILARLGRRPWFHQLYLLISLPMLAFLTLQFMTGHWTV